MNKYILYFSHNRLPILMEEFFQKKLIESSNGIPIVSVTKNPRTEYSKNFAHVNIKVNFNFNDWTSILYQMDKGIDAILEIDKNAIVYIAEHDVLYPISYFLNTPQDDKTLLKNFNLYFLMKKGYIGPHRSYIHSQTIGAAKLFKHCINEDIEIKKKFKTQNGYSLKSFNNEHASLDVRHGFNFTGPRYARTEEKYIKCLPYWGEYKDLLNAIPEIKAFGQDKQHGII